MGRSGGWRTTSSMQLWGRSWARIGLTGTTLLCSWLGCGCKKQYFSITLHLPTSLHKEQSPIPKEEDGQAPTDLAHPTYGSNPVLGHKADTSAWTLLKSIRAATSSARCLAPGKHDGCSSDCLHSRVMENSSIPIHSGQGAAGANGNCPRDNNPSWDRRAGTTLNTQDNQF